MRQRDRRPPLQKAEAMNTTRLIAMIVIATLIPQLALAKSAGSVELKTDGTFERIAVTYNCGAQGPLKVTYINADPNFLAVVPVASNRQNLVFSSVMAASGVRYAAGIWIWWTKGNSASLYDTTQGDNASPVTECTAIKDGN